MTRSVHVILNPASGGGAGRRVRAELERELERQGHRWALEETTGPGDAVERARAAAAGAEVVVAAGGDGTVHEVVNGLLAARAGAGAVVDPTLAVVPVGTGNDLVKVVTGGSDRRPAYEALATGTVRRFDVGRVEWEGGAEYFVNAFGTGIDVEVVRQIERLPRLRGVASYLVGLLRALVKFRPIPLRLRLDEVPSERSVMMIAVGNGRCVGGGFWICPDARPDDGRLDVCIVDELSMFQIARVLPRILRGTHVGMPGVSMARAESIEVAAGDDAPLFFQLDGELREPRAARRLRVAIEPGVLPVLTLPAALARAGRGAAGGRA